METIIEQPPRRLLLACSLAERADYSETRFADSGSEWFPRGLLVAYVSAWVGNHARKYTAMVPFRASMGEHLTEVLVGPVLKSAIIRALAENPNVTKPVGRLP